jgi:hypothetical protein
MAEQQEPIRRRVALKIIKLGMDTKQVIEIGFDWVCFFESAGVIYFHNALLNRGLNSSWLFGNWVCFA